MANTTLTAAVTESDVRARVVRLLAEHTRDDTVDFLGAQFDAGLARVDFPVGDGGLGAPPALQVVVDEALAAAGRFSGFDRNPMGIGMCAPTIVAWGTEAQRQRFLRPIFTATEIWCQLFSEPGAGPMWRRSPRGRDAMVTSGSSTARRSGRPPPTRPASGSSWRARTLTHPSTAA